MAKKVRVYSKTTGRKQAVPAHWLDHPVLGADFSKTPSTRKKATAPVEQAGSKPETNATPEHGDKE